MKQLAILGTGGAPLQDGNAPEPIVSAARHFRPVLRAVPAAIIPTTPAAREACAIAYVNAGLEAQRDGYAGIYINTVGDYGLADLRRACRIPVTGAGEGAIRSALVGDRRFAIVTIWPPALGFIYEAILEATDSAAACVGIRHLSDDRDLATLDRPDNFVREMQSCGMTSMARIRAACRAALEDDGADVILLGCTCMYPVTALLQADDLPLIEPMAAGYRYLESLVAGNAATIN